MGITIKDVENAIEAQNAQRSAGRVGTAPTVSEQQLYYTITTPGQLLTAEEFADIIVKADGPDKLVRMKDIATTEIGKRSYEFRVDINGTQGVNVGVYLQTGANAMAAAEAVKARIVELAAQFPENKIDYIITDDTSIFVGASSTRSTTRCSRQASSCSSSSSSSCRTGAPRSSRCSQCPCRSSARWRASGSSASRSTR